MKKRVCGLLWLPLFYCLLMCLHAPAQHNAGAGNSVTSTADTAAINKLLESAFPFREAAPDSALQMYTQALTLSRQAAYGTGISEAYLGQSRILSILNKYEASIAAAHSALLYGRDDKKWREREVNIYHAMAQSFYYLGKYDSCAWYRYKALNIVESTPNISLQLQMRAYGSILQFWMNAHEDIQNDRFIQQLMQHINTIEQKALVAKDSVMLVSVYFQKEAYYENIQKRDSSRYYCRRVVELGKRVKVTPSYIVASLLNMSISYLQENNPRAALPIIEQAVKEMPEPNKASNRYFVFSRFALGEVWYQLKDYDQAIRILEPALKMADEIHMFAYSDYAHKILAKTFDAAHKTDKAALHWRLYSDIRDSLNKDKKMELVYNVEMRYRIADKERELAQKELWIARNESRLKAQRYLIGGILSGTLLIILLSLLLYRNNKHKQKLQAEKIRNLHQELQISSLQAMIAGEEKERSRIARELHDGLGGTLAAIRTRLSYVFRKLDTRGEACSDFAETLQLLEEASVELRKTAHNLMPEILLREGLAKASLLFCERVRKGHMLEINTEIWGEVRRLPKDFELTAYRIIQELIHNTLKHARATQALVQIVFHDSLLCITVEDNGTGIPGESWQQLDGMGLKTIEERVKSLNGQIDIASSPGKGTSVYIELNIITTRQNVTD